VSTLIGWHRAGSDVQTLLPALSAQMAISTGFDLLVSDGVPELLAVTSERSKQARQPGGDRARSTVQAFFVTRLGRELDASPHTVDSYRHTFRLLLSYAKTETGKDPAQMDWLI